MSKPHQGHCCKKRELLAQTSDWLELVGLRSSPVRGERRGHARVQRRQGAKIFSISTFLLCLAAFPSQPSDQARTAFGMTISFDLLAPARLALIGLCWCPVYPGRSHVHVLPHRLPTASPFRLPSEGYPERSHAPVLQATTQLPLLIVRQLLISPLCAFASWREFPLLSGLLLQIWITDRYLG